MIKSLVFGIVSKFTSTIKTIITDNKARKFFKIKLLKISGEIEQDSKIKWFLCTR